MAHYAVPVKPMPVSPVSAATLVLLRDRPAGGLEVLLIQRHRASKFAGGDFVFPGGKVEVDDNPEDAPAWCRGLEVAEAARVLGLDAAPELAVGYWIGAIREAFEEVGVLLAYEADGREVRLDAPRFGGYRRDCQVDNRAFWEMLRAERLRLATDRLVYFAHWITPEEQPLRYDTRFFAAPMPPHQAAVADEREIIAVRWLTPRDALDARSRGELSLRLPTVKNLELLGGATSTAEALRALAGRPVSMIRPRLVVEDGVPRALLPDDPGYF
ncbi:MAG: hypothetical protein HY727_00870 [Candidatus Rokubacteria bacterium]|nr:hypothetical protein [Candidatus Rokubacteria bacterium]